MKRAVVGILLVSFFVPQFMLFSPKEAAAVFVPVFDIPNSPAHNLTAKQTFLNVTGKEFGLDSVLWIAAKMLIKTITSDLVSWINSGFNGAPAFVQNLHGFLLDVADRTLGAFLQGTALAFLCDPFKLNIRLSLQLGLFGIQERTACRLTDAIANLDSFLSGNFIEGGFGGLMYMTMVPQHNMYGAYLMQDTELALRFASAGHIAQKKLDFGNGFLSFEKCEEVPADPDVDPQFTCQTLTPGKVIESQLENVLGSGIRQLELADEFNEIVGALMSQLLQQVVTKGLAGLGSLTGGGAGGPSFIGQLRDEIMTPASRPTPEDVGFVLPPPPDVGLPPDQTAFSYTISSPGIVHVMPGGLASIPITKTLQTGTAASVSLTVPTSPSIVTNSAFGGDPCTPTCTSNVLFTISPTAAVGTYSATIGGSPAASNGTISVIINVTTTPPLDTVPPSISFGTAVGINNGFFLDIPVTFADNVAIDRLQITFTNTGEAFTATASPQTFRFNVSTFSTGTPLDFTAIAFDTAGNQTTFTKTMNIFGEPFTPPP